MYDVIVIGAGPAAAAAAFDLAAAGLCVLILDRREFPRKKACAGGITPKALALFRYDISPVIQRVCHTVRVRRPEGKTFVIRENTPLCYMTQRRQLDLLALNQARQKGAGFMKTDGIRAIDVQGHSVAVHTAQGLIQSRYLIGADGANSAVRRFAGIRPGIVKYPALEADIRVDRPRAYPMEFDFSLGFPGYVWIFPRQDHLNIGIYAADNKGRVNAGRLAAYAENRFGTVRLEGVKGYPIGTGGWRGRWGAGRILLAGDAGGGAEPLLGEGIYYALKTGQEAARAIILASRGQGQAAAIYQHALQRIRLDLGLYHLSAGMLYRCPSPALALARYPAVHKPFSRGFARGLTLGRILFPFL